MFNTVVSFILQMILKFASLLMSIFTYPIIALASLVIPDLSTYVSTFNSFVTLHLVPAIAWAREIFINVTGYPRSLLHTLAIIYLAKLTFHVSIIPIKFIYNVIRMFMGAPGEGELESH